MGISGSGKSTIVDLITGLRQPLQGHLWRELRFDQFRQRPSRGHLGPDAGLGSPDHPPSGFGGWQDRRRLPGPRQRGPRNHRGRTSARSGLIFCDGRRSVTRTANPDPGVTDGPQL